MIPSSKNDLSCFPCSSQTFFRVPLITSCKLSIDPPSANLRRKSPAVVGSGIRCQPVQVTLALPQSLDVIQTRSPTHDVVGHVQNMIRLVIGKMNLQQLHLFVRQWFITHPLHWDRRTSRPPRVPNTHPFQHLVRLAFPITGSRQSRHCLLLTAHCLPPTAY